MSTRHYRKSTTAAIATLMMGVTSGLPFLSSQPAFAQACQSDRSIDFVQTAIPSGVRIPVRSEQNRRILVTRDDVVDLQLTVAANVQDFDGTILIPYGSQVVGQIEPAGPGARFVADELIVNDRERYGIDAVSNVVTRTEVIESGASTGDILKGTLAGAGAATIIAGTTGNRRIGALEVLAGAAVGTLAGWALPEAGILGGGSKEVISIDPNRDLTLTLRDDLDLVTDNSTCNDPVIWIQRRDNYNQPYPVQQTYQQQTYQRQTYPQQTYQRQTYPQQSQAQPTSGYGWR